MLPWFCCICILYQCHHNQHFWLPHCVCVCVFMAVHLCNSSSCGVKCSIAWISYSWHLLQAFQPSCHVPLNEGVTLPFDQKTLEHAKCATACDLPHPCKSNVSIYFAVLCFPCLHGKSFHSKNLLCAVLQWQWVLDNTKKYIWF